MINNREFTSFGNSQIIDQGLRNYMLKIYNYMAGGLTATALSAYLVITNPSIFRLFFNEVGMTSLGWLILFAPLILIFSFNWVLKSGTAQQLQTMFWVYSLLMGISLAPIFLVYTGASIARVFLICAATFGALSLYGYTTKKDLTGLGTFLYMALFGLIIVSLVSLILLFFNLGNGGLINSVTYSYIAVLIFAGLTVYDTQNLKHMYYANGLSDDTIQKGAIAGALGLYLDFINMFINLLRLFGDRR